MPQSRRLFHSILVFSLYILRLKKPLESLVKKICPTYKFFHYPKRTTTTSRSVEHSVNSLVDRSFLRLAPSFRSG